MKKGKVIALILSLAMVFACATAVFACAGETNDGDDKNIETGNPDDNSDKDVKPDNTDEGGVVETPEGEHEHVYDSDRWSYDESGHYHAAKCEHNTLMQDFAAHEFEEGVCTVCGYKKEEHVHEYSDYKDNGDGTCSKTCGCGDKISQSHVISSEWITGNGKHWHACTLCGFECDKTDCTFTNYKADGNADTHTGICECGATCTEEHSYPQVYYVNDASHWHECICGNKSQAVAHDYKIENVSEEYLAAEADYVKSAEYYFSCECGKKGTERFSYGSPVPHEHEWGEWKEDVAPSCKEEGKRSRVCSLCGDTDSEDIEATGHSAVEDAAKEATCTVGGLKAGSHCSVCGEILVEQEVIPVKGHSEKSVAGKAATCTESGLTEGTVCSVCEEVITAQAVIPATGHTEIKDNAVTPSCTQEGKSEGSHCLICGTVIKKQTPIAATGHTPAVDVSVLPDCTHNGKTEGSHCSVCGEILVVQSVVPATGHTEVEDVGKSATCTESGLTAGSHCSECGEILTEQTVITALGHTEVTVEGTSATCTQSGLSDGKVCSVCGVVLEEQTVIAALGHDEVTDAAVAADCTHKGKTAGSHCSVCGLVIVAQEDVDELGHNWNDGEITTEPTATEDGVITYTCETCGETKTQAVPATGEPMFAENVLGEYGGDINAWASVTFVVTEDGISINHSDCFGSSYDGVITNLEKAGSTYEFTYYIDYGGSVENYSGTFSFSGNSVTIKDTYVGDTFSLAKK